MANCWDNLIGVRGFCDTTEPISGLYLNDLTGIELKALDAGVNTDANTAYELIQRKINQAANIMVQESKAYMANKWNFSTSVGDTPIGFFPESLEPLARANNWRGIGLRFSQLDYWQLNITSFTLLLPATGAVTIKAFDLRSGLELDSWVVNAVANTPTRLVVNKTYESYGQMLNLAFVYDATSVDSFQTSLYPTYGCNTCNRGMQKDGMILQRAVEFPTSGQVLEGNQTGQGFTAGMSLNYNVQCSFLSLMCAMMPSLAYGLLYKTATLLMEELALSTRLNAFITYNRDRHQELSEYYQSKYDKFMHDYWNNSQIGGKSCFSCNKRIRQRVVVP